jgi:hypothetical protein
MAVMAGMEPQLPFLEYLRLTLAVVAEELLHPVLVVTEALEVVVTEEVRGHLALTVL